MSLLLFENQTTSGNGSTKDLTKVRWFKHPNTFTLHLWGGFGGGTFTMQCSYDGTTWIDIPNISFTSATAYNIDIKTNYVRGVLTGATGASLYAWLAS